MTLKLFTILVILIKCSFSSLFGKTDEFMKKCLPSLSQISLKMIILQAPTIPHFKCLSMRNLQYKIRICQKQRTKVAMSTYCRCCNRFFETVFIWVNTVIIPPELTYSLITWDFPKTKMCITLCYFLLKQSVQTDEMDKQ